MSDQNDEQDNDQDDLDEYGLADTRIAKRDREILDAATRVDFVKAATTMVFTPATDFRGEKIIANGEETFIGPQTPPIDKKP